MPDGNEWDDDLGDVEMPEPKLSRDFLDRETDYNNSHGQVREVNVETLEEKEKQAIASYIECHICHTLFPTSQWRYHDCQATLNNGSGI